MEVEPVQFSDGDLAVMQEALERGEGRPVSKEELFPLLQWATIAGVNMVLLEMLLDGRLLVRRTPEGDFEFHDAELREGPFTMTC